MAFQFLTRLLKDGAGALFPQWVIDKSGTGAGPHITVVALMNEDASNIVSLEALNQAIVDAVGDAAIVLPQGAATETTIAAVLAKLQAGLSLNAGSAVIGKTVAAGPDFQAAGVAAVTGTLSASGNSSAISVAAGRQAYLTLSGGTSLTGAIQWSFDSGSTWANIVVEGTQLGTVSYAGTTVVIPVPTPEQASVQVRLAASAVSGTVSIRFSQ